MGHLDKRREKVLEAIIRKSFDLFRSVDNRVLPIYEHPDDKNCICFISGSLLPLNGVENVLGELFCDCSFKGALYKNLCGRSGDGYLGKILLRISEKKGIHEILRTGRRHTYLTIEEKDARNFCEVIKGLDRLISDKIEEPIRIVEKIRQEKIQYFGNEASELVGAEKIFQRVVLLKVAIRSGFDATFFGYYTKSSLIAGLSYPEITSVFSGEWSDFTSFFISALVTYIDLYGGLERIKKCAMCGQLCLPERQGADRGFYCSNICQQKSHSKNPHSTCLRRQRKYIRTRFKVVMDYVSDKNSQAKFDDVTYPDLLSTHICKAGNCPTPEIRVEGGGCLFFRDANKALIEMYTQIKAEKKKKR